MTKLRVHELAKELNISNNEIKAILGKNGIEIKSHMSAVDENMINIVKKGKLIYFAIYCAIAGLVTIACTLLK